MLFFYRWLLRITATPFKQKSVWILEMCTNCKLLISQKVIRASRDDAGFLPSFKEAVFVINASLSQECVVFGSDSSKDSQSNGFWMLGHLLIADSTCDVPNPPKKEARQKRALNSCNLDPALGCGTQQWCVATDIYTKTWYTKSEMESNWILPLEKSTHRNGLETALLGAAVAFQFQFASAFRYNLQ